MDRAWQTALLEKWTGGSSRDRPVATVMDGRLGRLNALPHSIRRRSLLNMIDHEDLDRGFAGLEK